MSNIKTDIEIAIELSYTHNKPHFIDTVRKFLNEYDNEEASFSKFVENLNIQAYRWAEYKDKQIAEQAKRIEELESSILDIVRKSLDRTNELQAEIDRVKELLKDRITSGSIDQHTKDLTWEAFKTEHNL